MKYVFSGKLKTASIALSVLGLIGLVVSFIVTDNQERVWANLLLNAFFFTGIAVASTFFIAVNIVGESGWYTMLRRIPEALGTYTWVGMTAVFLLVLFGVFHHHDLWEFLNPEIVKNDPIIQGKMGFLNTGFYLGRIIAYFLIWVGFAYLLRKFSLQDELQGGTFDHYIKVRKWAATFLILFAVTSSTSAWDILMSIDAHWFSTLFGWYIFAGIFVSCLSTTMIIMLHLKRNGYMPNLNESHIHDLGKFIFAFSIFWTYLYFSQFVLIWYANIPEEIVYFMERYDTSYRPIVLLMVAMNFAMPLLVLMTRNAKRNYNLLTGMALLILVGHWLDVYQIIMPGTVGTDRTLLDMFGLPEISCLLMFAGLFIFVVFSALTRANVEPTNATFLDESRHHQI
jgi:hypothetical protein